MGLMDDIQAEQVASRPGYECSTCRIVRTLPAKDRADLVAALAADSPFSSTAIIRALKKRGIEASHSSVQKHRREQHGA